MASFDVDPANNTKNWLTNLEESCSSMNSSVGNLLSLENVQMDDEDPLAEHYLQSIDEDDPFGEGIRYDIQLHIEKLVESGHWSI